MTIQKRQLNNRRQSRQNIFSWRALSVFFSAACIVSGIVYLVNMNDLIVKGFVLKDLKSQASLLSQENQDLQAKSLTLQSYAVLSPRMQNLNMVSVDDVAYFAPQESTVAKK